MAGFLGKEIAAWIKETRDRAPEWFNLAESLNIFCHEVLYEIEPHKDNGQEVLGAILFKRILCEFQAVIILEERGMYTDALIQRRGMLEALFVLGAIYNEPDIITDYVKNDIHRRLKIYKNIKERREMGSETLSKLITDKEIDKNISALSVASKGLRKLHVKDLAEAAGYYDLYLSDYSVLSEAAHHVSKDLERSVSLGSSDDMEYLIWGPEPGDPSMILLPTVDQMLMATRIASNIFKLKIDDKLKDFTNKIKNMPESNNGS